MDALISYAKSLNANQDVLSWLDTAGRKAVKVGSATDTDLEHIVDWLVVTDK